nr:ParB/RepB/Spo0J family partition protein [uncultured Leptotrichia sp.]
MKLLNLKIDKIVRNKNQPRKNFDIEKLEELKNSIKNNGLIQPIVVRKLNSNKYEIIAGERRYRACKELGMSEISALEVQANDSKSYEFSVLENIQRENLNPIEEAESYLMLMEVYGYNQEKLSEKLGKTRSSVSNKLRILKLPFSVKEMVRAGEISFGHSRTLLGLRDESQIEEMAKKVKNEKVSVRELERIIRNLSQKNNKKKYNNKEKCGKIEHENSEKEFIEDKLREFFETQVKIIGNLDSSGKIQIDFSDYEELKRIIELMEISF